MAKARTIEQILAENGLAFAPNMEQHYMTELEGIWNEACAENGGEITDARIDEYLDVLKKMGLAIPVHRETMDREHSKRRSARPDPEMVRMRKLISEEKASERSRKALRKAAKKAKDAAKTPDLSRKARGKLTGPGISGCGPDLSWEEMDKADLAETGPDPDEVYRIFPAQSKTDLGHKVFLILDVPKGRNVPHRIAGGFMNPDRRLAFEYYDGGAHYHMSSLDMSGADIRFRRLFSWLGTHHISVRLSGTRDQNSYYVYRIKAVDPPMDGGSLTPFEDQFLQYMIERIRTSILQASEEEIPEQLSMTTLPEIINFMDCCGDTLPANIRQWARKNIITAGQEGGNADEKRHAQRALSIMLNVQWKSDYFESIDEAVDGVDYLTVHVPLSDATKGMIDKKVFAHLKDAIVLNFSRDSLVNDDDLIQAIRRRLFCPILAPRRRRPKITAPSWPSTNSKTISKTATSPIR